MSLHIAKLFKNPLALAGVAVVMHIGATAAAAPGDAQQQARELLAGTTTAHSAAQPSTRSAPRDGKAGRPTADAQELARQVVLGTTGSRPGDAEAGKPSEVARAAGQSGRPPRPVVHGDAQAAARQLLLGQRAASDASGLTARRTR
jgi:hypothetical protein